MPIAKKRVISGGLRPRWPKPRIVRWLEVGALLALAGLWLPDWTGGYAALGGSTGLGVGFPPLLMFVGAVVLLVACAQGIKGMGRHWLVLRVFGGLAVAFAGASLAAHALAPSSATHRALPVLASFLAAFFATGFLWITLVKVAEITSEPRTRLTTQLVLVANLVGLGLALLTASRALQGDAGWLLWARGTQGTFTVAFLLCRYGVHCYHSQRTIGATFSASPTEQFWV